MSRLAGARQLVASPLWVLLLVLLQLQGARSSAVVRPTIFKSDSEQAPGQQQQQQQLQQQLQQQQLQQPPPQQQQAAPQAPGQQQAALALAQAQAPALAQLQQQHHFANGHHAPADGAPPPPPPAGHKIQPLKSRLCTGAQGARLDAPLGMQSYAIDDLALTASSFSNEQVRPHLARLHHDQSGGAWCPMKPISHSSFGKEWIQAKLNRSYVVSAVETQGRFALGSGKEFAPSYSIEYSRNSGQTWHRWQDYRGSWLLRANDDVNSPVRNELSPPIVGANVIRLVPHSQHLRTICLRFELHGCQYDEGAPLAYSMMDGVVEPRWGQFNDYSYDGVRQAGQLRAGLGQLTDGVRGPDNFSFNSGFEWVGWKSMNGDVVIEFAFKTLRNFTGALFHSNNLFSSGVEVFQGVDVHYGIDVGLSMDSLRDSLAEGQRRAAALAGQGGASAGGNSNNIINNNNNNDQQQTLWSADMLSIEYEPDKKLETSRPVTVHLKQRLANRLRFVLKFASKWILVSEVEFLSHPVELLSLASLNDQQTPQLMQALAPAKTYDEFVAILREHQLRRIATDAYLESFASTNLPASSQVGPEQNQEAPISSSETPHELEASEQYPLANGANLDPLIAGPRRVIGGGGSNGPAIATWPGINQQAMDFSLGQVIATNSNSNSNNNNNNMPPNYPQLIQQASDTVNNNQANVLISGNNPSEQQFDQQRTLGLATIVCLAMLAVLVASGLLFGLSSYRLRHHQHHQHHHQQQPKLPTQWYNPTGKKMGFMSQMLGVSSATSNGSPSLQHHHHHHHHLAHHQTLAGPISGGSSADSHYNPLFATSGRSSEGSLSGPLSTLRRLASFGATIKQQQQQPANNNLLFSQTANQANSSQLLVSLKDPASGATKSTTTGQRANNQLSIGGQLIVGLNQANPLAQQQIYSSNQTYATHYSASMSLASGGSSSLTNGGQLGDYASPEYAIPEGGSGQPMISSGSASSSQRPLLSAFSSNNNFRPSNHNHHHHFQAPFQQPTFQAGDTELRASHRLMSHGANNQIMQQQQQRMLAEHNYELIYGGDQQPTTGQQQQLQQMPMVMHNRTLSNQNVGDNCPPQFSSMTLSRHQQRANEQMALIRARQQQAASSPGSSSGQTTSLANDFGGLTSSSATTEPGAAASSSLANNSNNNPTNSHYYYSSTEAAKSCQLDKK